MRCRHLLTASAVILGMVVELLHVHELRVRVQFVEHAPDRRLHQIFDLRLFHVLRVDPVEDFAEALQLSVGIGVVPRFAPPRRDHERGDKDKSAEKDPAAAYCEHGRFLP